MPERKLRVTTLGNDKDWHPKLPFHMAKYFAIDTISLKSVGKHKEKILSLKLQKCNHFLSHAGRVVLCCVSPLLHLAVKWMKSWLIASGAYLACRLRQN